MVGAGRQVLEPSNVFNPEPTVVTSDQIGTMARLAERQRRYGDPIGPPATITREPGQSRKAAATAGTLCAGVWLVGLPP